jgi:carboxyl-terminal processing protease
MKIRGRVLVLAVSMTVVAFAVIGGFMSKAIARQESYQYLRTFEDVVSLILNNYVEEVNIDKVMHGAMHGLADGLDPDSAYLDAGQVKVFEKGDLGGPGQTGIELTRQYYLRVIAARDGSPAAKAGLMPGDYIRAIDGQSTRDTTVYEGQRLLRGKPGTKVHLTVLRGNAAEPHEIDLVREELAAAAVKSRIAAPGVGYLRIAEFGKGTTDQIKSEVSSLTKSGAKQLIVDVRGTAFGDVDAGIAVATKRRSPPVPAMARSHCRSRC